MTRLSAMFLIAWLQGSRQFHSPRALLCTRNADPLLLPCWRLAAHSSVACACSEEPVRRDAEAESGPRERCGRTAQEAEYRPSRSQLNVPAPLRLLEGKRLSNSPFDVLFLPPLAAFVRQITGPNGGFDFLSSPVPRDSAYRAYWRDLFESHLRRKGDSVGTSRLIFRRR